MLSTGSSSRLGAGALGRTASYSVSRSSALRGELVTSTSLRYSLMMTASSVNAQYMAAASISTLRSRSFIGLPPSIPLTPLQTRLQFRAITTETQSPSQSAPPPLPTAGADKNGTKVATNPPLSAAPPTPPLPVSSIPPKIAEVAAEKVQEKVAKREEKPKKGLPARAWAKVKEEASHYWHGTKLLGQEIKISAKLQYKVLQGSTLTRRERRQASLLLSPQTGLC